MSLEGPSLYRYMKLSTLLTLLDCKAYFPSVATMRSGDPLEAALGEEFSRTFWRCIKEKGNEEEVINWIFREGDGKPNRTRPPEMPPSGVGSIHAEHLAKLFADDLASRVAAWCWFSSEIESSSMWHVYGHQGVAVRTTLDHLRKALPEAKVFNFEPMTYVDRRIHSERSISKLYQTDPDRLLKPHFLKAIEYQCESELRAVTSCPEGALGLLIEGIDPGKLILEIIVSRHVPYVEVESIQKLVPETNVRRSSLQGYGMTAFREHVARGMYG